MDGMDVNFLGGCKGWILDCLKRPSIEGLMD